MPRQMCGPWLIFWFRVFCSSFFFSWGEEGLSQKGLGRVREREKEKKKKRQLKSFLLSLSALSFTPLFSRSLFGGVALFGGKKGRNQQ